METDTQPEVTTVRDFLSALEDLDIDRAVALLAPDVRYQNVSLPAAHGVDAVRKQLAFLSKYCTGFEAQLHTIAATGSNVMTERTDILRRGKFEAEFWVCGVFEVRDGRIVSWRDYFDWANILASLARGGVRALLPR